MSDHPVLIHLEEILGVVDVLFLSHVAVFTVYFSYRLRRHFSEHIAEHVAFDRWFLNWGSGALPDLILLLV